MPETCTYFAFHTHCLLTGQEANSGPVHIFSPFIHELHLSRGELWGYLSLHRRYGVEVILLLWDTVL
jgi:hypothetical protein